MKLDLSGLLFSYLIIIYYGYIMVNRKPLLHEINDSFSKMGLV